MTTVVTRWWWVRHAPVTDDGGCIYGQRDLDCDCSDAATFRWLASELPENAVLVTSDLRRTTQTAEGIVGGGLALPPPQREPALREQFFGDWQGVKRTEFAAMRDGLPHRFWIAPAYERTPNGESFTDVLARVAPAITRITAEHSGRDIVAVAHGGSIRAAIAFALRIDPQTALAFSIRNLSITRLDHIADDHSEGQWRATTVNQLPNQHVGISGGW